MKDIQNKILAIALLFTIHASFSQNLCNSLGNAVDGDFGTTGTFGSVTTTNPSLIVSSNHTDMDYFSNMAVGAPEVLTSINYDGLKIDTAPTPNMGGFCLLKKEIDLNNNIDETQELIFYAKNLVLGNLYEINFGQLFVQSDIMDPEFSKVQLEIHMGEEVFYSDVMTPTVPPGSGAPPVSVPWLHYGPQFCPTSTVEMIRVIPKIINPDPNHVNRVILAVDELKASIKIDKFCDYAAPVPCVNCSSFDLKIGEKYYVSGWVKQTNLDNSSLDVFTYENSSIEVNFFDAGNNLVAPAYSFSPQGDIIDGWQKMSGEFQVPVSATSLAISLVNITDTNAYFDDIRVHPFNSSLKSFVYDQETQKLMAELDENNYATFYEYDKEGGLVRVKKETEKGVFTIKETRSSNVKKTD